MIYTTTDSPIGELLLAGDGHTLARLDIRGGRRLVELDPRWEHRPAAFADACEQLQQYFAGERQEFDLELDLHGSPFELRVWQALREIPYGETRSYGQVAARVCEPAAARAVGVANARNPIALVVPCHRVIGANGSLTGYGGGLERKRTLLELEAGVAQLAVCGWRSSPAAARTKPLAAASPRPDVGTSRGSSTVASNSRAISPG